jgi:hypothetical protein
MGFFQLHAFLRTISFVRTIFNFSPATIVFERTSFAFKASLPDNIGEE